MKLTARTFKIEWDLHAWSGVVASLFLFVIFYCGMFALYTGAITQWQDPRQHEPPSPETRSLGQLVEQVLQQQPIPRGGRLELYKGGTSAHVTHEASALDREVPLGTSAPEPDEAYSRLGEELYVMHFFYRVPGGIEFSGFVAAAFFVALISGLVIQLKDFWRQLWQFRPTLRVRYSSSDAHKVLGVFGLPFATMYAWSGSVLGLYAIVASPLLYGVYRGDQPAFERAAGSAPEQHTPQERAADMQAVDRLVATATRALAQRTGTSLQPSAASSLLFTGYGNQDAELTVSFPASGLFGSERSVRLRATDGAIQQVTLQPGATDRVNRVLFGLHYAQFGGPLTRALYALLALGVCAVILTGNLIWVERRDAARAQRGHRWLERVTVGTSFGLVLASAGYFALNRLLPRAMPKRAHWEFGLFLALWAVAIAIACLPRLQPRASSRSFAAGGALLFAGVVAADLLTQRAHLLSALQLGLPGVFQVEALLLALACAMAALAWRLGR